MPEHNSESVHGSHGTHGNYNGHSTHGSRSFAALKRDLLEECPLDEREHRDVVLAAIEQKLARQGGRNAQAHRNRARQFMPFAALKGYADMVQQQAEKETLSPEPHFPRSPIALPKEPGSKRPDPRTDETAIRAKTEAKDPQPHHARDTLL